MDALALDNKGWLAEGVLPQSFRLENACVLRCGVCGEEFAAVGIPVKDRLHHTPGIFRMVACPGCGHRQLGRMLDGTQIQEAYPPHYVVRGLAPQNPSWRARLLRRFMTGVEESRVRLMQQHMPLGPESRVLDVGCGNGSFLESCSRVSGGAAIGLEPDEPSVWNARARGLAVYQGSLLDNELEPAGFDAITFWHVLEHTPDPVRELSAARQALKPGGCLFIGVPDAGGLAARIFGSCWFGCDAPRHVHQFTPAELVLVAERAGLQPRAVEHVTEVSTVAGSLHNLLGRRWCDNLEGNLLKWMAIQASCLPLDYLLRRLGLGDWMVMVCRRRPEGGNG